MSSDCSNKATILLIEVDEDTRRSIRTSLYKQGYSVISVESEEEALVVTVQGQARPDLIIINEDAPIEELLESGRRIRQRAELSDTVSVVVIPYTFDPEREGADVPDGERDYICYWAEPDQLYDLVSRLTKRELRDE